MEKELTTKEIIDCLRGLVDKYEKELEEAEKKEKSKPKREPKYWGDLCATPNFFCSEKTYLNTAVLKANDVIVGDRLLIGEDKYVVVNIDTVDAYYLMPCYNLDSIPMHPDECQYEWEKFEDTWMYKEYIPKFFKEKISPYCNATVTLASKEQIFGEYKFQYFKELFKEGGEKYLREFVKDSCFWLRSVATSTSFDIVDDTGTAPIYGASHSLGFRPLIVID